MWRQMVLYMRNVSAHGARARFHRKPDLCESDDGRPHLRRGRPLHLRTARLRDQSGARTGSKSFLRRILIFPCKKASKHSSAPKPFFCRASQNLIVCTNLDYLCFFPYFLFCFLHLVEFLSPELHARITRHTQVAARGYRNASDLRAIRQAGAFELLREKSPVERFQPF